MPCGCGGQSNMQAMTSTEVNQMLADARRSAEEEMQVLLASAQQAALNAGGVSPTASTPTE